MNTKAAIHSYLNNEPLAAVVAGIRKAVEANPKNAQVLFRSQASLIEGLSCTAKAGRHTIMADEPKSLGGDSSAQNPVELALSALATCQIITMRFWAALLDIRLEGITVAVEGDLDVRGFFGIDDQVRAGYSEIRCIVTLAGPEPRERYQELLDTVEAHCPVLDIINKPTIVRTELKID